MTAVEGERHMERAADLAASDNPHPKDAQLLYARHVAFSGRLLFVGFGVVGQAVLPLLLRHIDISPEQITIVTAADR